MGFILRDLQAQDLKNDEDFADNGNIPTDSETGWGITTSGKRSLTWWAEEDFLAEAITTYLQSISKRYRASLQTASSEES